MNLDLNIKNYSIRDIESFLQLPPNYTEREMDGNIQNMRDTIEKSGSLDEDTKEKLNMFLKMSKIMLFATSISNTKQSIGSGGVGVGVGTTPVSTPSPVSSASDMSSHQIQDPNVVSVKNVYDYKFPVGIVNSIERRSLTKALCIDSLFRENYDRTVSTNFQYVLPQTIPNVVNMKVTNIEIPNFWYDFSVKKKTNCFTIKLYNVCGYGVASTASTASSSLLPKMDAIPENITGISKSNTIGTVASQVPSTTTTTTGPLTPVFPPQPPQPPQPTHPVMTYSESADYTFVIHIPEGNYDTSSIVPTLNNIFLNTKHGLDFLIFSIDKTNSKCVFRCRDIVIDSSRGGNFPYNSSIGNLFYSPNFYFSIFFDCYDNDCGRSSNNNNNDDDDDDDNECDYEENRGGGGGGGGGGGNNRSCHKYNKKKQNTNKSPLYKNVGWMFGFKKCRYTVYKTDVFVSFSQSSTSIITYYGFMESESSFGNAISNYLFIDIDDYQKNFSPDAVVSNNSKSSFIGNNIMGRISVNSGFNTIICDGGGGKVMREYFGSVKLEKLNIRILDKYGDVVDLNGNDISLVIEVQILY